MDLAFAPEDAAFREEVRTFLREKLPERLRYKVENGVEQQYGDMLEWHRTLAAKGWVAPNWPAEYGGPGWTLTQKYIFDEECGLAGAPRIVSFGIESAILHRPGRRWRDSIRSWVISAMIRLIRSQTTRRGHRLSSETTSRSA